MPNARITFASDPEERSRGEDSLCAYTWQQNLLNPDNPELNVYLPMVRAAVRSMDAITEFSQQELDTEIEKYVISGASKRGWTTWLTGAMDQDRIIGILPVVWDAINVAEIFHHQIKSYGGWSWAVEDYVENNIPLYLDTPELEVMQDLIDPYRYRDRLTMPKLVITGLMDEFQMADDEQFWWDDMPGPKWLVKSPNTEHTQVTGIGVAVPMMGTWLTYLLNDWELPYVTWDYEEDSGDITVEVHDGEVYTAQKWYATSCSQDRRDFSLANHDDPCECGIQVDDYCSTTSYLWSKETLEPNSDGSYTAHMDPPEDGKFGAFIINVQLLTEHSKFNEPGHTFFTRPRPREGVEEDRTGRWPITPPGILEFSSRSSVVPNTFPHDDCSAESCEAPLV